MHALRVKKICTSNPPTTLCVAMTPADALSIKGKLGTMDSLPLPDADPAAVWPFTMLANASANTQEEQQKEGQG